MSAQMAPAPPAATTAVFTSAQAESGRAAYESSCGKCHTGKLTGRKGEPGELPEIGSLPAAMQKVVRSFGGKVPPLVGAPFTSKWGTTKDLALRLKEAVSGFPPQDATEDTYLHLTAYILSANGARAGAQAMTKDTAVEIGSLNLRFDSKGK